ncbi:hypothetical protein BDQ12DRAFT_740187 [Crucibulum laeve]|uniref:Uncharacterized protein n=1 Tax=Crucibulum laeve TaxID=68775 RepID=A0A5C3LDB5_9AGAR|nr:hypothetical protein BDQ12DRAFT_740187 [Crucibulum laeve]
MARGRLPKRTHNIICLKGQPARTNHFAPKESTHGDESHENLHLMGMDYGLERERVGEDTKGSDIEEDEEEDCWEDSVKLTSYGASLTNLGGLWIGLTEKAAVWAVRKERGHRTISRRAMMEIEAVLNRN